MITLKLVTEAENLPRNSSVRLDNVNYTLVHEIVGSVNGISSPISGYFLVTDEGRIRIITKDTLVIWLCTKKQLKDWLQ